MTSHGITLVWYGMIWYNMMCIEWPDLSLRNIKKWKSFEKLERDSCMLFIDTGIYLYFGCDKSGLLQDEAVSTLGPRQNGRHFADDIFKCIVVTENVWFPTKISLKFVPKGLINNIPSFVQLLALRRPGDKPLSEPMIISLPTHKCVVRQYWVLRKMHPFHTNISWFYVFVYKFPYRTTEQRCCVIWYLCDANSINWQLSPNVRHLSVSLR